MVFAEELKYINASFPCAGIFFEKKKKKKKEIYDLDCVFSPQLFSIRAKEQRSLVISGRRHARTNEGLPLSQHGKPNCRVSFDSSDHGTPLTADKQRLIDKQLVIFTDVKHCTFRDLNECTCKFPIFFFTLTFTESLSVFISFNVG